MNQSTGQNQQSQPLINYGNVKYSFKCLRRHLLKDKVYHVLALQNMITIGEHLNDPNPKYKLELNLKNTVYWKQVHGQNKAFGIKYKKNVKYFEASTEQLTKFREAISCFIGFHSIDDHYKIEKMIGSGSFSQVHKVFRLHDDKAFAMKQVSNQQKTDKENMQLLENEIGILHSLNNEAIVKIYEVFRIEENQYGLIIEFVDGICLATLIEQLKKNQNQLKEEDIKILLKEILKALNFIHQEQVIHRDIKPQNIMISQSSFKNVKIIDFGLSIKNSQQYNRCGTPGYMAPEIVNMKKEDQKPWTSLCDIFSLGVVFYKILSKGINCFQGQTSDQIVANNKKCQIDWSNVQQFNYSDNCISLLKAMLAKDPEERISADQALQHPFFIDLPPVLETDFAGNDMTQQSKVIVNQIIDKPNLDSIAESLNDFSGNQKQHIYVREFKPSRISKENSKEFSDFSILKTKNSETQVVQPIDNPPPIKFTQQEAEEIIQKFRVYKPQNKQFKYENLLKFQNCKLKIYKDSYYFGQLVNGKKNGFGVILSNNGRTYEGQFENDRKHGSGFERFPDGASYNGTYINGKPDGVGKFLWANGEVYEGGWQNGLKHGQGIWNGIKGDSYVGEWKMGNPEGYGVHVWVNGDRYEGEFHNSLKHGEGIEYLINGDVYKGQYVNGKPEGVGEYQWSSGSYYNGTFSNGLRHGKGLWIKDRNATLTDNYDGEFVNDKKCGYGVYKWAKGSKYEGNFYDDLRHGYGSMFWNDGSYYIGMWEQGYQWGEGEYCKKGEQPKFGTFEKNLLVIEDQEKLSQYHSKLPPQIRIRQYTTSQRSVRSNSQRPSSQSQQRNVRPSSVKSVNQIKQGSMGNNQFLCKKRRQPSFTKQTFDLDF
ncbi:unnamed protein product [Paramecium primaurelia]|uniref:Protein kinase domain-containing protein n=1 Tax=Paramecium primaurelia TaxID=5886 RepID=A0A8S1M7T6_PARPR|nr:unnamed protein product [Paramecium primaurelia]